MPWKYNKEAGNKKARGFLFIIFLFYFPMKVVGGHVYRSVARLSWSQGKFTALHKIYLNISAHNYWMHLRLSSIIRGILAEIPGPCLLITALIYNDLRKVPLSDSIQQCTDLEEGFLEWQVEDHQYSANELKQRACFV